MPETLMDRAYAALTGEDDGRVCKDIPEEACDEQPRNFMLHVASLAATKTGDGLADPKLTLAWLMTALGAPAGLVGLLVPVREAGSLLPQLVTAGWIRTRRRRKWLWAAGSLVQGLAVAGMALIALTLDGAVAGWLLIALLAVFAIARSVCSVSYKDVLGKTISKSTRGTATGLAATIAAAFVLAFGVAVTLGLIPLTIDAIAIVLCVAAALWCTAAGLFTLLAEADGSTEGGANALDVALKQLSLLRTDRALRRFIATRGLLISTALAPPYLLAVSGSDAEAGTNDALGRLGPFVVAAAIASLTSAYIWGRSSDRSSRRVLIRAGLIAAAVLTCSAVAGWLGLGGAAYSVWVFAPLLFVLMIAHMGVRVGRATHIVDMASEENRAAYTALSNTVIGVLLLIAGAFAAVAQWFGYEIVLALFAAMALGAATVGRGLDEVQAN